MSPMRNSVSVVIIDDNPRSLEFVSSALNREGVEIFTASDPEQGIDLVYSHRPQVVVTDLVMPNMSGLEVLERIIDFDPATDVVLMTAHNTTDTAEATSHRAADDLMNQPA